MNKLLALALIAALAIVHVPAQGHVYYLPQVSRSTGKGVSGAHARQVSCANMATVEISWAHNWTLTPPRCPGVDGVPMIATAAVSRDILDGQVALPDGYRMQLWNEPDLMYAIEPVVAAQLFRELEPQLRRYTSLVAPVPSEKDTDWLRRWVRAYEDLYGEKPRFDVVAFHCYAQRADMCIAFGQRAVEWAKEWGATEVWCTEFGFWYPGWRAEATVFVNWMKAEPMVTRWAWYALHSGPAPLVTSHEEGALTEFGQWYATQ